MHVDFIKKHAYLLLGGACLIIVGIIYMVGRGAPAEVIRGGERLFYAGAEDYAPGAAAQPAYIVVHITGAVNSPGVIELREGARVNDALELAGGARADADLTRINLAAVLRDAMQIIVPAQGEDIENVFIYADAGGAQNGGLININTATSAELQALSGIGPVLSQSIIDFREAHGNFSTVDELINVAGIGPATLERIRASVTVD